MFSDSAYNNGQGGVTSLLAETAMSLRFDEDGKLSGSAGCNGFSATYTIDGEALEIGKSASTRKHCPEPEGLMDQERRFLEALENDPSVKPDPDWDDSVVALINYPEVVELLNDDIDWTWRLGEAVVSQQADVVAAIETFRDNVWFTRATSLQETSRLTVFV